MNCLDQIPLHTPPAAGKSELHQTDDSKVLVKDVSSTLH